MTEEALRGAKVKPKAPGKHTQAQLLLKTHLEELGMQVVLEARVCSERLWRFDLLITDCRVGVEVDGGLWTGGHKRNLALEGDYEKQNTAQMLGYRILRFSNRQVLCGEAKEFIRQWLESPANSLPIAATGQIGE